MSSLRGTCPLDVFTSGAIVSACIEGSKLSPIDCDYFSDGNPSVTDKTDTAIRVARSRHVPLLRVNQQAIVNSLNAKAAGI